MGGPGQDERQRGGADANRQRPHGRAGRSSEITTERVTATDAATFTFCPIALCSCHDRIIAPQRGCRWSHECNRSEPREKRAAAGSTNGVVGSKGTKIPTKAMARLAWPRTTKVVRISPPTQSCHATRC